MASQPRDIPPRLSVPAVEEDEEDEEGSSSGDEYDDELPSGPHALGEVVPLSPGLRARWLARTTGSPREAGSLEAALQLKQRMAEERRRQAFRSWLAGKSSKRSRAAAAAAEADQGGDASSGVQVERLVEGAGPRARVQKEGRGQLMTTTTEAGFSLLGAAASERRVRRVQAKLQRLAEKKARLAEKKARLQEAEAAERAELRETARAGAHARRPTRG